MDALIDSLGGYLCAMNWAWGMMHASQYPSQTAERRMAGTPNDEEEYEPAVSVLPNEFLPNGTMHRRAQAAVILRDCERVVGGDWLSVQLALSCFAPELSTASNTLAERLNYPREYTKQICYRWRQRREGVPKMMRSKTCSQLIELSERTDKTERRMRSEIYSMLDDAFRAATDRLSRA